jgi:beta-N-acetylhexosaminidase
MVAHDCSGGRERGFVHAIDLDALAGRVIIAGFEGLDLPEDIRVALSSGSLGGVILFKRNIDSLEQTAALLSRVRDAWSLSHAPIIGVDQEGGRVVRLRDPLTVLPPAARFGALDRPDLTEEAGALVGRELSAVGFTFDFAPVLDVATNPDSPVIGDRAFGATPEAVIRHALPFGRGLLRGGVCPCGKHFPGHGDAALDSHLALPRVSHDRARLEAVEMAPFAAWCRAGIGPVMSAHVVYTSLDPYGPATLSALILTSLLRDGIGFDGVIFSDDMEMGAIEALGGAGQVAVRAVAAGVDGLLVCRRTEHREAVRSALARRAADDISFRERLQSSAERLAALPVPDSAPSPTWIGSDEHQRMQRRVMEPLESVAK